MTYRQEYHRDCAGRPVIETTYEPTREEWLERQTLKEGTTARDECNFFNRADYHHLPFSDEMTFEESRQQHQELMGYIGDEF
ncbi:MAG: hypothetical protein ACRC6M_14860, partial [Microcystaceae cyanobacterium]